MQARSWRWLRTRILGLVDRPPAGYIDEYIDEYVDEKSVRRRPVWSTRVQTVVFDRQAQ